MALARVIGYVPADARPCPPDPGDSHPRGSRRRARRVAGQPRSGSTSTARSWTSPRTAARTPATSVVLARGGRPQERLDASDGWDSTRWTISPTPAAPLLGLFPDGMPTVSFNLTAPAAAGKYDVIFEVFRGRDCNGYSLSRRSTRGSRSPHRRRTRPPGPLRGERHADPRQVRLDRIVQATGAVAVGGQGVRERAQGDRLEVAIIDFSSTAKLQLDYAAVTQAKIDSTGTLHRQQTPGWLQPQWLDQLGGRVQGVSKQTNTEGTVADLVVFITDGDPNSAQRRQRPGGDRPHRGRGAGRSPRPRPRPTTSRRQKSHVFALGVGSAVTKPESARRLTAVSGTQQYPEPEADSGRPTTPWSRTSTTWRRRCGRSPSRCARRR